MEDFSKFQDQAGFCPDCKQPLVIRRVQKEGVNKGRLFASCQNRSHNSFKWIVEKVGYVAPPEKPKAPPVLYNLPPLQAMVTKITQDLSRLNQDQLFVVKQLEGALACEAVPGSGKTRVLEERTVYALAHGIHPSRIGCFTFSNSGAEEMRVRIAKRVFRDLTPTQEAFFANPKIDDFDFEGIDQAWVDADPIRKFLVEWVCTIHALAYRLLKAAGVKFRVIDGKPKYELENLIEDSIKELGWDEARKTVMHFISLAINNFIEPYDSLDFFENVALQAGGPEWCVPKLAELYKRYHNFMRKHNLVDFDMLQVMCVKKLRSEPAFREAAQNMFDLIMVDESQDCNAIQNEILFTIAAKCGNLMYCGDVDQSMYSFRGAVPSVMREDFDKRWQARTRSSLPVNYRSTRAIIGAAKQLISANYNDSNSIYRKNFATRDDAPEGEPLTLIKSSSFGELCSEVVAQVVQHEKPGDFFVLSRTRAECAEIHTALINANIPAINKSGGLLFGSPHVRKVIAYAKLACNYRNARNDLDILKEIANVATAEFLAPMTRRRHLDTCNNEKPWINCGCPIVMEEGKDHSHVRYYANAAIEEAGGWSGIERQCNDRNRMGNPSIKGRAASDLVEFVYDVEKLKGNAELALRMIIDDCVMPWLAVDEGVGDDLAENGKQEDFALLTNRVKPEQTLEQYLDEIENLTGKSSEGNENESVIVGTFHYSKGKERPVVIVNATRCPIIPPKPKKGHLMCGRPPTLEEERRLVFVGVTRAKEQCIVVKSAEWLGQPSSPDTFVNELGLLKGDNDGTEDVQVSE